MEAWIKVFLGLSSLLLSLGCLYRPSIVLRLNAWAREAVFNDRHVLFHRRRWGLLLFLCAIVLFYSGFQNLAHHLSHEKPSSYLALQDAYRSFRAERYKGAVTRCQEILKREKDNVHAWALLGAAWSALGRKDQAARAWEEVLKRDPRHPTGRDLSSEPKS